MKISETKLKDCLIIEPDIHKDDRGFFMKPWVKFEIEDFFITPKNRPINFLNRNIVWLKQT